MTRPSCPKGQSLGREGSVAGGGVEGVCVRGGCSCSPSRTDNLTAQLAGPLYTAPRLPLGVRVHSLWEVALRPGRPQSRV